MFSTFAKASVSSGGGVPASQSQGSKGWHPTVVYLGVLVAAEFFAVGFLTHYLLKEE